MSRARNQSGKRRRTIVRRASSRVAREIAASTFSFTERTPLEHGFAHVFRDRIVPILRRQETRRQAMRGKADLDRRGRSGGCGGAGGWVHVSENWYRISSARMTLGQCFSLKSDCPPPKAVTHSRSNSTYEGRILIQGGNVARMTTDPFFQ